MSPKPRVQKRLYYKIGEACKALDIQPYVLRYWETEFPALSPNKSRSGQRVYSEKELGVIRRIKELLYEEGYTIAGAKKKLEAELASGLLPREAPEEEAGQAGGGAEEAATAQAGGGGPAGERAAAMDLLPEGGAAGTGTALEANAAAAAPANPARAEGARRPVARRVGGAAGRVALGGAAEASAAPAQRSLLLDTQAAERVESMRQGIQKALDEAREILTLLKSPSRR